MRNSLKGLALVAGLAVGASSMAEAQTPVTTATSWSWAGCGGNTFNTCASVNISLSGSTLTMVVQNWGTYNPATNSFASLAGSSIFTEIALANNTFGTGSFTGLTSFACVNDPNVCDWEFGANGLGAQYTANGAGATPPPAINGLDAPATSGAGNWTQVTLVFSTSGTINLSGATFGLHGQSGPQKISDPTQTCSTKLFVSTTGPNSATAASSADCDVFNPPTETPIPEPASMVLLATGLVAMGGAGIIRRRRNRKV
jgi:hypothetical protein